jgi:hypothetical protein
VPFEFQNLSTWKAALTFVKIASEEEQIPDDTLFQKHGAPLYFRKKVTDVLNEKFPQKCTGKVKT